MKKLINFVLRKRFLVVFLPAAACLLAGFFLLNYFLPVKAADLTCQEDPEGWYLNRWPDVKNSGYGQVAGGGLKHFCENGKNEGPRENCFARDACASTTPATCQDDPEAWYLNRYPDVKDSSYGQMINGGLKHFCEYGKNEATPRENCFAPNACGSTTADASSAPTISSFTANPSSITSGQTSTLSWSVANATSISISGLGMVTGTSRDVTPTVTTTYTLTATNDSGSATANATVTVSAPTEQRWVGYWGSAMNGVGKGNYIAETASVSNIIYIRGGTTAEVLTKLKQTKAANLKAIIMMQNVFFPWKSSVLHSDYASRFKTFWDSCKPYQDIIAGFYVYDEPYWQNLQDGQIKVSNSELKSSLVKVIDLLKEKAPGRFTAIAFAYKELDIQNFFSELIPSNLDFFGVNCYLSFGDACSDAKIKDYWSKMIQSLKSNQHLLVTLDSYWPAPPSAEVETKLINRLRTWKGLISANQDKVLGFFPFIYQDYTSSPGAEKSYGAESLPQTRKEYEVYMKELLGAPSPKSPICQTDPNGWYLNRWPDVKASRYGQMPEGGLRHFCSYGRNENFRENCFPKNVCDAPAKTCQADPNSWYLDRWPDVKAHSYYGTITNGGLKHFCDWGRNENFRESCFSVSQC